MRIQVLNPICLVLVGIAIAALCVGCNGKPPVRIVDIDPASLQVGSSALDVRALYGSPEHAYTMEFGQETDHIWDGVVWEYKMGNNPTYVWTQRPLKGRLVFAVAGSDTLLNHWDLERPVAPARVQ